MNYEQAILIIVGALIGIPFAIFANLFTEPIRGWFANRSHRAADKRLRELENQMERVTELSKSSVKLTKYSYRMLSEVALYMMIYIVISSIAAIIDEILFSILSEISMYLLACGGLFQVYKWYDMMKAVDEFSKFKELTEEKISKLRLTLRRFEQHTKYSD